MRRLVRTGAAGIAGRPPVVARGAERSFGSLPFFNIVETTLREGEQHGSANFNHSDRVYIAKTLDKMGVEYIELVNPVASSQASQDASRIAGLGLKAKVLVHTRCHMNDVEAAIACGVQGVSMYLATSTALAKHSHGIIGPEAIVKHVRPVVERVREAGLEVRFSCEDTFRSDPTELLEIYQAVDELGVDRVGLADTVGIATPLQVYDIVKQVRGVLKDSTGIEFHAHNDTGCAIANALMAIEGGATHINTTILGIGERNGITSLGGLLARMYTMDKDELKSKYNVAMLSRLEKYVAHVCDVDVPFNNIITGQFSFTHKAGVHTKAIMNDPSSYEVIDPADFGVERHVQLAHRLTGWNAMHSRARQLSLDISEDQIKAATAMIKNLADERAVTMDHVDSVLIKLASGPKSSSSTFLKWTTGDSNVPEELRAAAQAAAKAMESFETAQALAAISAVREGMVDSRITFVVQLVGHLFDKAVLNRVMDVLVAQDADFSIVSIDVPKTDAGVTKAVIKVWSKDEAEMRILQDALISLSESMSNIAETSILLGSDEDMLSGEPIGL